MLNKIKWEYTVKTIILNNWYNKLDCENTFPRSLGCNEEHVLEGKAEYWLRFFHFCKHKASKDKENCFIVDHNAPVSLVLSWTSCLNPIPIIPEHDQIKLHHKAKHTIFLQILENNKHFFRNLYILTWFSWHYFWVSLLYLN